MYEKKFTRIARSIAIGQGLTKEQVSQIEISRVESRGDTVTFFGKELTQEIMRKLTSLLPTKEVFFDF